jgi:DNA-binding GntR family transcriptional regulator
MIPGQRIVEIDLAAELHASRFVVRQALSFLAGRGLVEFTPRQSPRIRRTDTTKLAEMLDVTLALWRLGLEWGTCPSVRPKVRETMYLFIQEAESTQTIIPGDAVQLVFKYHHSICEVCGNMALSEIISPISFVWYPWIQYHRAEITLSLLDRYSFATGKILADGVDVGRRLLHRLMADVMADIKRQLLNPAAIHSLD